MLEPHAVEIRQELTAVRVGALRDAARPSHPGPLRRAVGNAFVRLGLRLGSDGSVPPSVVQPASVKGVSARAEIPFLASARHAPARPGAWAGSVLSTEADLAWELAAPYGIRVGAPFSRTRSRS
jgi:hypothetical protein